MPSKEKRINVSENVVKVLTFSSLACLIPSLHLSLCCPLTLRLQVTDPEYNTICEYMMRPAVIITARCHPGETPPSFMMRGILNFLTSNDSKPIMLRQRWIPPPLALLSSLIPPPLPLLASSSCTQPQPHHRCIKHAKVHSLTRIRSVHRYVFKLIPMVNPDGVVSGNSRCTLQGLDLNRMWNESAMDEKRRGMMPFPK